MGESIVDEFRQQAYESADEYIDAHAPAKSENSGDVEELSQGEAGTIEGGLPYDRGTTGAGEGTETGGRPQVRRSASKMDGKNADSRELFGNDGGFKLGQEITQDGDIIAAQRKAKEEAQAAQDAAQGDMRTEASSADP